MHCGFCTFEDSLSVRCVLHLAHMHAHIDKLFYLAALLRVLQDAHNLQDSRVLTLKKSAA